MKRKTRIDHEGLPSDSFEFNLKRFVASAESMYQLACQKAELVKLCELGLASDDISGIVHLIDWVQDEMAIQSTFMEQALFPFAEDYDVEKGEDVAVGEQEIPIALELQEKLKAIRKIFLEDLPLHVNDDDPWIAGYAKHSLEEGMLDPCGYLLKYLKA